MATVGNLFVNVRGRTNGFVKDMERAKKKIGKRRVPGGKRVVDADIQVAREKIKPAIKSKLETVPGSPKRLIAEKRLEKARNAVVRLQSKQRLQEKRDLLLRKKASGQRIGARGRSVAALGRAAFMGVAAAAGVSVIGLLSIIKKGVGVGIQTGLSSPGAMVAQAKAQVALTRFALRPDVSKEFGKAIENLIPSMLLFSEVVLKVVEGLNTMADGAKVIGHFLGFDTLQGFSSSPSSPRMDLPDRSQMGPGNQPVGVA